MPATRVPLIEVAQVPLDTNFNAGLRAEISSDTPEFTVIPHLTAERSPEPVQDAFALKVMLCCGLVLDDPLTTLPVLAKLPAIVRVLTMALLPLPKPRLAPELMVTDLIVVDVSRETLLPTVVAITTSEADVGTTPPTHVPVAVQSPPELVLVIVLA